MILSALFLQPFKCKKKQFQGRGNNAVSTISEKCLVTNAVLENLPKNHKNFVK